MTYSMPAARIEPASSTQGMHALYPELAAAAARPFLQRLTAGCMASTLFATLLVPLRIDHRAVACSGKGHAYGAADDRRNHPTGYAAGALAAWQQSVARCARVMALLSRDPLDWRVNDREAREAVALLIADPDTEQTVSALRAAGFLEKLFERVQAPSLRRALIDAWAIRLGERNAHAVERALHRLFKQESLAEYRAHGGSPLRLSPRATPYWEIRWSLARLGLPSHPDIGVDRAHYRDLVPARYDRAAPLTGSGATGVNPALGDVPAEDRMKLLLDDRLRWYPQTTDRYDNPARTDLTSQEYAQYFHYPGLDEYAAQSARNLREAELILKAPISSLMGELYGDQPPARTEIMLLAAAHYRLEPELLAAVILAEQRDQSANEDAKDYVASKLGISDTSIGLGQIRADRALRDEGDLFAALLSPETRRMLSRADAALLLADDVGNIFATAAKLRHMADQAAELGGSVGKNHFCTVYRETCSEGFHGGVDDVADYDAPGTVFDVMAYAEHGCNWPLGNKVLIGREHDRPSAYRTDGYIFRSPWAALVRHSYLAIRDADIFAACAPVQGPATSRTD